MRVLMTLLVAGVYATSVAVADTEPLNSVEAERLERVHREAFERLEVSEAIVAAERQLAIQRQVHGARSLEAAATLKALATYETMLPDYEAAEAHAREALAIRRERLGERNLDVAASQRCLALTLRGLDRLDEAEGLLRDSLAISEALAGEGSAIGATTRTDLGMVLTEQDKLDEAESQLQRALDSQRALAGRRVLDEARTLRWLAQCVLAAVRLEESETLAKESLAIRQRLHDGPHLDVAESFDLLAEIYHAQRFLQDAAKATKDALAIRQELLGDDHPLTLAGMHNLAVIEMSVGNHANAEPLLRQVLPAEQRRLGKNHPEVAFTLSTLAINLSEQGKYAEAQSYYREAREILVAIDPDHPDLRWLLDYWGRDADKRGDLETAESRFLEVNEMVRRTLGHDNWAMLAYIAGLRVAKGEFAAAEEFLLRAASEYEESRAVHGSGIKAATAASSVNVSLALVQLELGKSEEAWSAVDLTRGRTLTAMLADRYGMPGDADTVQQVGKGFVFSRGRVQRTLDPTTAIVGWIDHAVRESHPASWGYVIRNEGPVHWARLDRLGAATTLELSKYFSDFSATISDVPVSALGGTPALDADDDSAGAVWRARFEPLHRALEGVDTLIVIPSEIMAGLPVESLVAPDGTAVGDRFAVSYAPSASVYAWLREKPRPAREVNDALLVGDPPFRRAHLEVMKAVTAPTHLAAEVRPNRSVLRSALEGDRSALGSLPRLAWSRWEVAQIGGLLTDKTVLVGRQANEADIVSLPADRMKRFDVLHFATHALVDGQRPNCSSLVLSQIDLPEATPRPCDEPTVDGMLTGEEIAATWKLDSELVTLSACETGLGRDVRHEGVIGFSHPFFQAGTRSLLVSLWKVDDQATALLMERFYENWIGADSDDDTRSTKAVALQRAKLWLREYEDANGNRPYEHPYYWSAFVLVGDSR